jgi:hypothetical protein
MKINQSLMGTAGPSNRASLRLGHCAGVFAKQIERAALLVVAHLTNVVLTTGCPSTGTGFGARMMSPVHSNQQAANSENGDWYQPSRSPEFDPDSSITVYNQGVELMLAKIDKHEKKIAH